MRNMSASCLSNERAIEIESRERRKEIEKKRKETGKRYDSRYKYKTEKRDVMFVVVAMYFARQNGFNISVDSREVSLPRSRMCIKN